MRRERSNAAGRRRASSARIPCNRSIGARFIRRQLRGSVSPFSYSTPAPCIGSSPAVASTGRIPHKRQVRTITKVATCTCTIKFRALHQRCSISSSRRGASKRGIVRVGWGCSPPSSTRTLALEIGGFRGLPLTSEPFFWQRDLLRPLPGGSFRARIGPDGSRLPLGG